MRLNFIEHSDWLEKDLAGSWDLIVIKILLPRTKVRDDDSLCWMVVEIEFRHILETELLGLVDELDVDRRETVNQNDLNVFEL